MALVYGPGRFTKGQQNELAKMQHKDDAGDTFAHEQHSRPQKRFLGHRRYVKTLGTGMLQTGTALASLSVILRERSINPGAYPRHAGTAARFGGGETHTSLGTAFAAQRRENARA